MSDTPQQNDIEANKSIAKLRHGQAMSMQYVGFLLQKIIAQGNQGVALTTLLGSTRSVGGTDARALTVLGCIWVENIVIALAIELSLKALLAKECGSDLHTHDLLRLFNKLQPETQEEIETKFHEHRKEMMTLREASMRELLEDHRNDFVNWRYLDKNIEPLMSEGKALQITICSILDVYNSN